MANTAHTSISSCPKFNLCVKKTNLRNAFSFAVFTFSVRDRRLWDIQWVMYRHSLLALKSVPHSLFILISIYLNMVDVSWTDMAGLPRLFRADAKGEEDVKTTVPWVLRCLLESFWRWRRCWSSFSSTYIWLTKTLFYCIYFGGCRCL